MAQKTASAVWNGSLTDGNGTISTASGVLDGAPYTWKIRTSDDNAQTSPEELIAAAHGGCYAMAFSNYLGNQGTPAEKLDVSATVTFGPNPAGGMKVTKSHLKVVGTVPGMDAAAFAEAAKAGEQACPVSNALRNNVEITVESSLA